MMPVPQSLIKIAAVIVLTVASIAPLAVVAKKPAPAAQREAADRFSLDLPPAADDSAVAAPTQDPATPVEPAAESASEKPPSRFTLDTPIAQLLADYRSKAVLDRDMPGLSTDKNLAKFKPLSLNALAPLSDGRLGPDLLEKVGKHLGEIE